MVVGRADGVGHDGLGKGFAEDKMNDYAVVLSNPFCCVGCLEGGAVLTSYQGQGSRPSLQRQVEGRWRIAGACELVGHLIWLSCLQGPGLPSLFLGFGARGPSGLR